MKRAISLIMTIFLFLGFCACSGEAQPTEPLETVSLNDLFSDTDNGAKAQLNVGKAVTVYGRISSISSTSCIVMLAYPARATVSVEMPIERLAELEKNQFIAVEGVVTSFNSSNVQKYTISATTMLDLEAMDAYIKKTVTDVHAYRVLMEYSGEANAAMTHSVLQQSINFSLVDDYVRARGDAFKLMDDTELSQYLIGKWVYDTSYGGIKTQSCEYKKDGTYLWKYQSQNSYTGKVYDKEQTGKWSVQKGDLTSFRGSDTYVYVLCDDVFLQMGQLHIRVDYQ